VAIGRGGADIRAETALDHVFAYGVGIDLTRRDLQFEARDKGRPWDWGKAFDLSAPIAPLHRASNVGHPASGRIWLAVNGAMKQDADLTELIWPVPDIITILSRSMTLKPGDLIMTGTPAGVGAIVPGDEVTGASTASVKLKLPSCLARGRATQNELFVQPQKTVASKGGNCEGCDERKLAAMLCRFPTRASASRR
jgi:2-keto-4-pentenoate hydratase/2-oxohepta-3-ene-1,7-dioic acid hydratase in catechol pathway